MRLKNLYIAIIALCLVPFSSRAQSESGYFIENYSYRHQLNPALTGGSNYFSIPALGNMHVSMDGNLRMDDIFYAHNGKLNLFTSDFVSTQEALSKFSNDNKLIQELNLQILSCGFESFGGYNTIGLSLRENLGVNLPYTLFEVLKDLQNTDYDITGVDVRARAYSELSFGHSRKIGNDLRVGAKVKVLIGVGNVTGKVENLNLRLSQPSRWIVTGNAVIDASVKGLQYKSSLHDYEDKALGQYEAIDDVDVKSPGIDGMGFAVDLGAEYDMSKILPGLKVSMALLDLGFIHWNNCLRAANDPNKQLVFEGFNNIQVSNGPGTSLDDQVKALGDDFRALTHMEDKGNQGSVNTSLGATLILGGEYKLPTYQKLRFGLLSTTKINGKYSWNRERFSVNVNPLKWFEVGANFSVGSFGASLGWLLNFHTKGFTAFLATDHNIGKLFKQGIPVSSRADVSFGLNIAW